MNAPSPMPDPTVASRPASTLMGTRHARTGWVLAILAGVLWGPWFRQELVFNGFSYKAGVLLPPDWPYVIFAGGAVAVAVLLLGQRVGWEGLWFFWLAAWLAVGVIGTVGMVTAITGYAVWEAFVDSYGWAASYETWTWLGVQAQRAPRAVEEVAWVALRVWVLGMPLVLASSVFRRDRGTA